MVLDNIAIFRSMLPSDLQLMLKPDCKASVDVITEKYSGVGSTSKKLHCIYVLGWFLPDGCPPHQAADFPHPVQVKVHLIEMSSCPHISDQL